MKRTVLVLSFLDMFLVGYTYLRIPILDRLISVAHTNKLAAGLAFTLYSSFGALGMPLWGALVDRMENRKPIIASLSLVTALGTILIIHLGGVLGVLLGMALAGLGSMGVYPVGYVLISDITSPKYRATAYSFRSIINGAGQALVAAYAIFIGVHEGIKAEVYAYLFTLFFLTVLYLLIGDNIPPSKGRKKPSVKKRLKILKSSDLNHRLMFFVLIYAVPRGALQVWMVTYFVEAWGMTETMASVMMGILAAPAFLSFPIVKLIDYMYNERRLWIRPVSAGVAIMSFSVLFIAFFSIHYVRPYELTDRVDRAILLIIEAISKDNVLRRAFLLGALAFVIAGIVGPMKNGILADGNLPEYRGILYSSLSIIDTISRGLGAFMAGAIGEFVSLKVALETIPTVRIPSAIIMLSISRTFENEYKNVMREIAYRLGDSQRNKVPHHALRSWSLFRLYPRRSRLIRDLFV